MSRLELVYGIHAVEAVLQYQPTRLVELFFVNGTLNPRLKALLQQAKQQRVSVSFMTAKELSHLTKEAQHQGIVARVTVNEVKPLDLMTFIEGLEKPPFLLILDGVQDPHNLGACLRTADAAGVDAVIAPKDNAVGITPAVRKVACGATETLPFFQVTNLARTMTQLKEKGIWLFGADMAGDVSLYQADFKGPTALVMGAEGKGLRRLTKETCDQLISIPMLGHVESMNVSVSSGIVLYEVVRQRLGNA